MAFSCRNCSISGGWLLQAVSECIQRQGRGLSTWFCDWRVMVFLMYARNGVRPAKGSLQCRKRYDQEPTGYSHACHHAPHARHSRSGGFIPPSFSRTVLKYRIHSKLRTVCATGGQLRDGSHGHPNPSAPQFRLSILLWRWHTAQWPSGPRGLPMPPGLFWVAPYEGGFL